MRRTTRPTLDSAVLPGVRVRKNKSTIAMIYPLEYVAVIRITSFQLLKCLSLATVCLPNGRHCKIESHSPIRQFYFVHCFPPTVSRRGADSFACKSNICRVVDLLSSRTSRCSFSTFVTTRSASQASVFRQDKNKWHKRLIYWTLKIRQSNPNAKATTATLGCHTCDAAADCYAGGNIRIVTTFICVMPCFAKLVLFFVVAN